MSTSIPNPLVGLVAVLGGLQLFGVFGVILGPIIAALFLSMSEIFPKILEK